MGCVTSCVLWLIYNALRLHCWGCRCVSTCQRDIILSHSLTKSCLWFTFVVSLLELFEFWSFHREIPACDSMRCSGSELWSYCAASRRTVDWLQETFEVFQLISTSFAMKTRHCWNLLEVKMMSATFISKMNCELLEDLIIFCSIVLQNVLLHLLSGNTLNNISDSLYRRRHTELWGTFVTMEELQSHAIHRFLERNSYRKTINSVKCNNVVMKYWKNKMSEPKTSEQNRCVQRIIRRVRRWLLRENVDS